MAIRNLLWCLLGLIFPVIAIIWMCIGKDKAIPLGMLGGALVVHLHDAIRRRSEIKRLAGLEEPGKKEPGNENPSKNPSENSSENPVEEQPVEDPVDDDPFETTSALGFKLPPFLRDAYENYLSKTQMEILSLEDEIKRTPKMFKKKHEELHERIATARAIVNDFSSKLVNMVFYHESVELGAYPLYKDAFELFVKGNLSDALEKLSEARLEKNENKSKFDKLYAATTRVLRAQLLEMANDSAGAEANYLKAVEYAPSAKHYFQIGMFYERHHKPERVEHYKKLFQAISATADAKLALAKKMIEENTDTIEYYHTRTALKEALVLYRDVASATPRECCPFVALNLHELAVITSKTSDARQAEAYFKESVELFRGCYKVNPNLNREPFFGALRAHGTYLRDRGEFDRAEALLQEALEYYKEYAATTGEKKELTPVANTLCALGELFRIKKDPERATAIFLESLEYYRIIEDKQNITLLLTSLGNIKREHEDYTGALPYFRESLALSYELPVLDGHKEEHQGLIGTLLASLGDIHHHLEDLFQAEAYFRSALELYRELEAAKPRTQQNELAGALSHLGDIYRERKDYPAALASYQEALALYRMLIITNEAYRQDAVRVLLSLSTYYQRCIPDKTFSVQYAREVIAYRHSAGHYPSVRRNIEKAQQIILQWKESLP